MGLVPRLVATIVVLAVCTVSWKTLGPRSFLPVSKWFSVQDRYEAIGLDGLYCMKVDLSEMEFERAVAALGLRGMESHPSYDTSPANCKSEWWDISFPAEAQAYSKSENGSLRSFAAFKNGHFYYAHEVR